MNAYRMLEKAMRVSGAGLLFDMTRRASSASGQARWSTCTESAVAQEMWKF
jgi:hypothetical protein